MICPVLSSCTEIRIGGLIRLEKYPCQGWKCFDRLEVENRAIFWIDAEDITNLKKSQLAPGAEAFDKLTQGPTAVFDFMFGVMKCDAQVGNMLKLPCASASSEKQRRDFEELITQERWAAVKRMNTYEYMTNMTS